MVKGKQSGMEKNRKDKNFPQSPVSVEEGSNKVKTRQRLKGGGRDGRRQTQEMRNYFGPTK